eukprot:gene12797-12925_t
MLACGASFAATADANFAVKCAGCHVNGGNIVQAGATLFTNDLQKNNVADADSLYQLIYQGQGRMPGFGQNCTPKAPEVCLEVIITVVMSFLDHFASAEFGSKKFILTRSWKLLMDF